jgi:hypothetical protein
MMQAEKQPARVAMGGAAEQPKRSSDSGGLIPASEALQQMLDSLPPDRFTLKWLSGYLQRRSFGLIVLVLALIAMIPGVSYIAGLLLFVPAIEMIMGKSAPNFPNRIANYPLPTRALTVAVRRTLPVLRYLERVIRPRWKLPLATTKRLVGIAVFLLTALLLTPLPFIQVVPGIVIIVLSVAYIEDDGLLLLLGLFATLALLAASAGAVWGMIVALS